MGRIKLEFENKAGTKLAGLLEMPPQSIAINRYALFAHCFTCGKDIVAASRISRTLASRGIAVLRFDFTGLGSSDGDFANSNFSSNVDDLLAAAKKLSEDYQPPQLLIGHSLGGTAVLVAAHKLDSIKAVVTIGSPSNAKHVKHLFQSDVNAIKQKGEAEVSVGGRPFLIKQQLLDDLDSYDSKNPLAKLNAALLICHSPVDNIVSIDQANEIYQAARHPKSFMSLDKADHLLSKAADAEYVANTISTWAARYLELDMVNQQVSLVEQKPLPHGEVLVTELDKSFLRGLFSDSHRLMADEPASSGGSNLGPTPYDLLLMSLGACTSMTLRMYANRKKWPLTDIEVQLKHDRVHAEDCESCDRKMDVLSRSISLTGPLTEDQRLRLMEIADKCPVHRTLENNPKIVTELTESG